jgi:pimeloyl-ACP methyl ester carboxylesterase
MGLLLVAFTLFACAAAARSFPPLPGMLGARWRSRVPTPTVTFFENYVDHFNEESDASYYPQRVLWSAEYWGRSMRWRQHAGAGGCPGPIFFYTGNESPVTDYYYNSGFMTDVLAKEHGALIVFAEHRYFGLSMPFGNASFLPKNVGYLSPDQALADYAVLLTHLKEEWFNGTAKNCPVVAFGGSYGGMLTAWFRMKYPNIVIGGLAASAPFGFYGTGLTPYAYMDTAQQSYAQATPNCDQQLAAAILDMVALSNTSQGLAQMSSAFPTCEPLNTTQDGLNLLSWVQNALIYMVELNYDTASNYGIQFPAWPLNKTCQDMQKMQNGSPLQAIAYAIQNYYNSTGDKTCVDIVADQPDFAYSPGWDYIACTAAYMPMAQRGMWWPHYEYAPGPDVTQCVQQWDIPLRLNWSRIHWGGFDSFKWGSNIIFSNGLIDPWHALGVLESPNEKSSVIAIVIPESAHHADLRGPDPADPIYLTKARAKEAAIIGSWLDNFYEERK